MKAFLLIFLLSSCATYYKDLPRLEKAKKDKTFTWSDKVKVDYKDGERLPLTFGTSDRLLSVFFKKSDKPNFEVLELIIKDDSILYNNIHPVQAGMVHVLTLGLLPYWGGNTLVATAKLKNLATGELKTIEIDLDHTSGSGWYYWIKKWSNDDWFWHRKGVDPYYKNEFKYYHDFTSSLVE